ncbi:hypothetical protein CER18_04990 [Bartonella tribocorum]|uniref:Uncharacterized protein n=1 Tax=Bartonella tribocorum TaxID=85701 RepID=A0A2M6USA1_9HYPH|nr:hypothetical protein CER18_04990 [Bartonella tribocorum]
MTNHLPLNCKRIPSFYQIICKTTTIDLALHVFILIDNCTHLLRHIYGNQIKGARGGVLNAKIEKGRCDTDKLALSHI